MRSKAAPQAADSSRVSQTAPETKSLSAAIWEYLESQPGFNEAIAKGSKEIVEGRSARLREVKRHR